jgi:hypothetical protein
MRPVTTVAIITAFVVPLALAVPAQAQRRDRAEPRDRGDRQRTEAAPQQRSSGGRQDRNAPQRSAPSYNTGRNAAPRAVPRAVVPQGRNYGNNRSYDGRNYGNRSYDGRNYGNRSYDGRYYGNRSYDYRPGYRGAYNYYRPYAYTFRPRLRIGFGVYLGYPLAYPAYDPYAYSPIYGYPSVSAYGAYGGVSLEISPSDAAVSVDGQYVGIVYDFFDPGRPLSLGVGRHHINVQRPGYRPLDFDVNVVPGEVLPYRGDLAPF